MEVGEEGLGEGVIQYDDMMVVELDRSKVVAEVCSHP